jgi:hypothetical protein
MVVNGAGNVQSVIIANGGASYRVGDTIGAILGLGAGFQMTVMAINQTGQGPFLMTIGGHVELPATMSPIGGGGADTTGNRWFTDGEKLIRSRAKYELAINVLRDDVLARINSPFAPEHNGNVVGSTYDAYEALSAQSNRMNAMGRIRPMLF